MLSKKLGLKRDNLFCSSNVGNLVSSSIPDKIKNKFIELYEWILILTSSLLMGFLSDYWLSQYDEKSKIIQIVGTVGGVLKIYQMINKVIAKLLLMIMKKKIDTKKKEYKINLHKKIALTSVLNDEFKDFQYSDATIKEAHLRANQAIT